MTKASLNDLTGITLLPKKVNTTMKAPYIYRMNVSLATDIAEDQLREAREATERSLPGYRKYLRKIVSSSDSLSIEVCMPLGDGKGIMSILLSLAAEYIRIHYGSEVGESEWVINPDTAPDPDEDKFSSFTGKLFPKFGLKKRKKASRDHIGYINLPDGMAPFIKSIACG